MAAQVLPLGGSLVSPSLVNAAIHRADSAHARTFGGVPRPPAPSSPAASKPKLVQCMSSTTQQGQQQGEVRGPLPCS